MTDPAFDIAGAIAVVGYDLPAVARAAERLALSIARRRRVVLVDLLGDDSPLAARSTDPDPHGISDAIRYGVSLSHILRPFPRTSNLFLVPGGVETPLRDDVLTDRLWATWVQQFRDADALMLAAAPSDHGAIGTLLDRFDGVVVVGDAPPPPTRSPLLGRIRSDRRAASSAIEPARRAPASRSRGRRSRGRMALGAALVAVLAAAGWGGRLYWTARNAPGTGTRAVFPTIAVPGDVTPSPPALSASDSQNAAQWAVELASVNSADGALLRVRQAVDSVPVPTYSPTLLGAATVPWYRLVAGAYSRVASADSLLAALRDRGVVEMGAGRVIRAPYAWLLEDSLPPEVTTERLFAWRQQGLPAYALFGAVGLARIYVGAFESEAEARLLAPALDSLDIHATLTMRVGSIR
jgi:hypothetical protein